jgi:hypothetical protein
MASAGDGGVSADLLEPLCGRANVTAQEEEKERRRAKREGPRNEIIELAVKAR